MAASSLSVLILWGATSTSLAPLLIFSLVLGLAAGGWTSLYSVRTPHFSPPCLTNR